MDATTLQTVAVVGGVLGVASHLGYFIHGEHHMHGSRILLSFFTITAFLFMAVLRLAENHYFLAASRITATASASFLGTLTISILTYRVFFHPLRNFPGPFGAKFSKFSHFFLNIKDVRNFQLVDKLHKQYGEFMRSVTPIVSTHFSILFHCLSLQLLTTDYSESVPTNLQQYLQMRLL